MIYLLLIAVIFLVALGWSLCVTAKQSDELMEELMRKLLVLLALLSIPLFPITALCASYLTCDCTPAVDLVTSFQLQFDATAWADVPAVLTCGTTTDKVTCAGDQRTFCYDLGPLANGSHTVKARAISTAWGASDDSVPFIFTKAKPTSPLLRVVH